jgi:hypothetical protein
MAELVKPKVNEDEVLIMKVALPKILRHTNKLPPSLRYNIIGKKFIIGLKTDKNPNAGYQILGDDGWMIEEDYLNKDFAKYGLKEYFERSGKVAQANALAAENSNLQEAVLTKDAALIEALALIEKLKAEVEKKAAPEKEETEEPKKETVVEPKKEEPKAKTELKDKIKTEETK